MSNWLWDIPMGFETKRLWLIGDYWSIMRHPYGIWNSSSTALYFFVAGLWDIPMGFETISYERCLQIRYIMRHPYGIWNYWFSCWWNLSRHYETSLWDLKLVNNERYITIANYETSLWDLKLFLFLPILAFSCYYETSLWDLKLKPAAVIDRHYFIMRHPYGIWN